MGSEGQRAAKLLSFKLWEWFRSGQTQARCTCIKWTIFYVHAREICFRQNLAHIKSVDIIVMYVQGQFVSEKNWHIVGLMTKFLCICRGNLFGKNLVHRERDYIIFPFSFHHKVRLEAKKLVAVSLKTGTLWNILVTFSKISLVGYFSYSYFVPIHQVNLEKRPAECQPKASQSGHGNVF